MSAGAGRETGPAQVHVRVPAKVNLFLAVRGVRDDGLHEIVTVMHTVGLYDAVSAELEGPVGACFHPAGPEAMNLTFCHDAGHDVPSDETNLVTRAAVVLAREIGVQHRLGDRARTDAGDGLTSTHLELAKHIPVAGGMAGGSADAAGALVALNRLWNAGLDVQRLRELGATLGSDVPFCVSGGSALATGTGATTARVLTRGTYWWVVGMSDEPLATEDVYRAWDEVGAPGTEEPDAVLHALRTGDAETLGAALHNDLEVAALHLRPGLAAGRDALVDAGALGVVLSGSGPTILALAADNAHAAAIAQTTAERFDRVEVVRSPAGGPELVPDAN